MEREEEMRTRVATLRGWWRRAATALRSGVNLIARLSATFVATRIFLFRLVPSRLAANSERLAGSDYPRAEDGIGGREDLGTRLRGEMPIGID